MLKLQASAISTETILCHIKTHHVSAKCVIILWCSVTFKYSSSQENHCCVCMTLKTAFLDNTGPKHSTSVPFSSEVAVLLSVEEKEVALVPNPVPVVTMKGLPDQQGPVLMFACCLSFCNHVQVQT